MVPGIPGAIQGWPGGPRHPLGDPGRVPGVLGVIREGVPGVVGVIQGCTQRMGPGGDPRCPRGHSGVHREIPGIPGLTQECPGQVPGILGVIQGCPGGFWAFWGSPRGGPNIPGLI